MSNSGFWIPFNNDFALLKRLEETFSSRAGKNRIEGIYFPAPQEYFGSARVVSPFTLDNAIKIIDFCSKLGWKTNMLLNSSCEGGGWYSPEFISRTLFLVKKLNSAGLSGATLTNPIYIQKIKKEVPALKLTASVICEIDSVQSAGFFEDLGADAFVPDRDINRNLDLLKEIKEATEMEMTLMVNEGCLFRCPQRIVHYNYISHRSRIEKEKQIDFPSNYCVALRGQRPEELLKMQFILPQHLKYYRKITSSFKIVGRKKDTHEILQMTQAYIEENFKGNLLDIMSSATPEIKNQYGFNIPAQLLDDGFFRKVTSCSKNCTKCNYCKELVDRLLKS